MTCKDRCKFAAICKVNPPDDRMPDECPNAQWLDDIWLDTMDMMSEEDEPDAEEV